MHLVGLYTYFIMYFIHSILTIMSQSVFRPFSESCSCYKNTVSPSFHIIIIISFGYNINIYAKGEF